VTLKYWRVIKDNHVKTHSLARVKEIYIFAGKLRELLKLLTR